MHVLSGHIDALLHAWGYWAIFALVLLETTGIPSPGETALIIAGAYAASAHGFSIVLVVTAAASAAIIGDNIGFWIGREGGWRLMRRYGQVIHIEPWRLKVGIYVFRRYGARIVYFGRFIPLLRTWGAMLTGVNRYPWSRFLLWNSLGAITWAVMWGTLSYAFGRSLQAAEGTATMAALGIAIVISVVAGIVTIRKAEELRAAAEREFPGSLDELASS